MMVKVLAWMLMGVLAFSEQAVAQSVQLHAELSGAAEIPPTDSQAQGRATLRFDTTTHQLDYTITYDGLSGEVQHVDIRGPSDVGANGQVFSIPIPDSPITGTATLTKDEAAALLAGAFYIDVSTERYPKGEIRGRIER